MKNIFLSVVIICALAIAGVGGTLAGFSDTETILDNKIEMGSIDLKVNGTDDAPWGKGIKPIIKLTKLNPGEPYKTTVNLRNAGDKDGYLYLIFKNEQCYNIETRHAKWWYEEPESPYGMKPEPELIAEYGGPDGTDAIPTQGKVDCTWVTGWGVTGDNCSMMSHVFLAVAFDGRWIKGTPERPHSLQSWDDGVIPLPVLEKCGGKHTVTFWVNVPQIEDPDWPYPKNEPAELAYWPTNALMADGISFDIELLLFDKELPIK